MEAIKKRMQHTNPNLSNSLILRPTETEIQATCTIIDNTINASPDDTVTTLMKIVPMNSSTALIKKPAEPIDGIVEPLKPITIIPKSKCKSDTNNKFLHTITSSKYLTSINKKEKISSNKEGKAMSLFAHLHDFKSIHIKIFHISWITLFISFFCYQSIYCLRGQISSDLQLNSTHISLSISVQSFSMMIFSIIFGDLCDKIGARYCYIFIGIFSLISIILILITYNIITFIILSFFIGIIGSSFVITQYHITQFFSSKCVGIANGLSAGWGFFFATFASSNLNIISTKYNIIWKYISLIPFLLLFIILFIYYFNTIDSPKGNISKEYISMRKIFKIPKYKYIRILSDYRIWILSLSYCISFGIEMTTLNYFIDYISFEFKILNIDNNYINHGLILVSIINLFGRGIGGYLSDLLYLKYGLQGRIYCLFCTILFESIFLFLFALSSFHFGYTMLMFSFFILYVQISEGIVFAIVPNLPHQMYIGLCMGIIAAGGAAGSMIGSFIFLHVPIYITYQTAWYICSIFVFISSFTILSVKFTKKEINDDLRNNMNDFWTCVGDKYESKNKNNNGEKKNVGFVIH